MVEDAPQSNGTLRTLERAERLQEVEGWQAIISQMEGPRGGMPERPDDPVAWKPLDAAGDAIGRRDWQRGVNILRLVIRDYRHSQEAAFARTVLERIDQMRGR